MGIREKSFAVACPLCGSLPGINCMGVKGQDRKAVHVERMSAGKLPKHKHAHFFRNTPKPEAYPCR
jgi:hypothetical protein